MIQISNKQSQRNEAEKRKIIGIKYFPHRYLIFGVKIETNKQKKKIEFCIELDYIEGIALKEDNR